MNSTFVNEIMSKNVLTIDKSVSLQEAAQNMNKLNIGCVIVTDGTKPLGIITERDFVRKIAAQDKQASLIPLSEIMSYKFRWVEPSTEIEDAVQKMLNHNVRRLIVLEDGKLVGVITQTDLADFLRSRLLIEGTVKNIESEKP